MGNLSQLQYRTDRAARNTLRCAARALGLTPRALLALPRGELRRLVKRARGRAEKQWHEASLRLDAIIALDDAVLEGRL
jgi:hypothetical protein